MFKTHCDHTFGGQEWFDVLNQMGGCPAEFVDAYNVAIGRRLQAMIVETNSSRMALAADSAERAKMTVPVGVLLARL